MTRPGKTPDEPGNRRQADGPQVLPERTKDEDMRELQDPFDLPFPDDSDRRPSGHPEYAVVVDQLAAGSQADHPH